ncbi:hypothetical protein Hte_002463 [Hypoxylon texense]
MRGSRQGSTRGGSRGRDHQPRDRDYDCRRQPRGDDDVSLLNFDLQDWLKLTGWHDAKYRNEKLIDFRLAPLEKPEVDIDSSPGDRYSDAYVAKNGRNYTRPYTSKTDPATFSRGRSYSPPPRNERYDYRSRDHDQQYGTDKYEDRHRTPKKTTQNRPSERANSYTGSIREIWKERGRDFDREKALEMAPKPVPFGEKSDVLFYMIRSYNYDNVYDCMEEGIWATPRAAEQVLSMAFTMARTVVLIFSVNQSWAIQGYAIMKSPPSASTPRPRWWNKVGWDKSEPFEVEWLCKTHIASTVVRRIKNSLNEGMPVTVSYNCQQVDSQSGRKLIATLESHAKQKAKRQERSGSSTAQ